MFEKIYFSRQEGSNDTPWHDILCKIFKDIMQDILKIF